MANTLVEIAQQLKDANKKVQLIYAFNGTGKTRLSRQFKELISPSQITNDDGELVDNEEPTRSKIIYYNALTEDLFYWDNDLEQDLEPKLKIQANTFTDWILRRGEDRNIISNFQRYTNDKLTPSFIEEDIVKEGRKTGEKTYPEVTFSIDTGSERSGNIKISKGEESNFIWSIFYTLLKEVISILDQPDINERDDDQFNQLKYVFIDDPISSLDENHLIELAVNLALLIKESTYQNGNGVKFIITTHNPLFYNVLYNELGNDLYKSVPNGKAKKVYSRDQSLKYRLGKNSDGTFSLNKSNDHPFSYHLFLMSEIQKAIDDNKIRKYHFSFMRNILEKTATFLGFSRWEELLKKVNGNPDPFANRILNLSSHSAHSGEEVAAIEQYDKDKLKELVEYLKQTYKFK